MTLLAPWTKARPGSSPRPSWPQLRSVRWSTAFYPGAGIDLQSLIGHSHSSNLTSPTILHPVRHHLCYSLPVSHKDLALVQLPSSHSLLYHLYANDTQTCGHCSTSDILALISHLAFCISDLAKSYSALRLQLNPSKTEFIWFSTRRNLNKIPHEHLLLSVGSSIVPCSAIVRDLDVLLDSELSMKHTSVRSPAPDIIIWEGYIRSAITSAVKPWSSYWCLLWHPASTIATPC